MEVGVRGLAASGEGVGMEAGGEISPVLGVMVVDVMGAVENVAHG